MSQRSLSHLVNLDSFHWESGEVKHAFEACVCGWVLPPSMVEIGAPDNLHISLGPLSIIFVCPMCREHAWTMELGGMETQVQLDRVVGRCGGYDCLTVPPGQPPMTKREYEDAIDACLSMAGVADGEWNMRFIHALDSKGLKLAPSHLPRKQPHYHKAPKPKEDEPLNWPESWIEEK